MNQDLTRGPVVWSMLLFAIPMILGHCRIVRWCLKSHRKFRRPLAFLAVSAVLNIALDSGSSSV